MILQQNSTKTTISLLFSERQGMIEDSNDLLYFLVIQLEEIFRMTLLEVLRSYLLSIDPICATNNTVLFKQLPRYIK